MDYCSIFATILYCIVIQKTFQYENLALNRTVTVSKRYNNKDFDPSLAVDGDHSTDLLMCSLTASGQKEAWLTVDLVEKRNIALFSFIHGGLGTNAKPIDYKTSGIYRRGTSKTVETSPTGSRYLCYEHFTRNDAKVVCLIWGLLPDNGYIHEEARQFGNSMENFNYDCIGNETAIKDCSKNIAPCPSSNDLKGRTELTCKGGDTLAGFAVYLSDTIDWKSGTPCYQHNITQPLNNTVNIECFMSGRYVTIYNSRFQTRVSSLSEFAYINICEINITGCDVGFYGENCTKCSDNCLNNDCHFQTGHCFDCKDGFNGEMCEECPHGRYGKTCSFQCGNCQNELQCNSINGFCHYGCASGWMGDRCDQENLSLNKTVTVSKRYNNKDFDPSLAVDGNHSTDLLKCSLTASGQKEAWLTVDLGEKKNIASVSFIHGSLGTNAKPIDHKTSGIYRRGTSSTVETRPTNSRYLCYEHFTENDAKVVCLIWGLLPDNGYIHEETRQFGNSMENFNYDCIGNETAIKDCPRNNDPCPTSNYFKGRTELTCKGGDTLAGFAVYLSDTIDWKSGTPCYQHDFTQPLNDIVNIECFMPGRYVTIYNSRFQTNESSLSEFAFINICEINIRGCDVGFYGENCTKCPGNCLNDDCNFQIGHCFDCKDGFSGEMCEECPHGLYGKTCSLQCGNCLNELPCNYINGSCHGGCLSGWKGDKCDQKCSSSQFGPNCNTSCSEYCLDRKCNQSTGHCLACIDAHSGLLCENINSPETQGLGRSVAVADIPFTIIGGVVGVFVIVLLALLVVCLLVRRKRRLDTKSEDAIGLEPMETPMSERKTNVYFDDSDEESPMSYHNVSYITNAEEQRNSQLEDTESEIETKSARSMADLNNVELISENLGDIPIKELHDYILRKHEVMDEGFKAEFKALPEGDITRCSVGSQDKNILKNRFKNTLPYDLTRVILKEDNGEDYINANFISDAFGGQQYIASQGPKPTTVKDFWRMIWQETIHTIVMLTGIIEGKKRKCEQYWPSPGKTLIYGKISVTSLEEKNYAFYTIRRLKITNDQETRYQNHFHFTGWPDHGIPSTMQLLLFYFRVKDQIRNDQETSPLVVHCSAGVGRTGTFIAIDALVQYGISKGTVNVTKYVSAMRRDRMHMIQTTGQYITVYKCLDELFNYPRHVICRDSINEQIGSTLTEEFQEVSRYINDQRELSGLDSQPDLMDNSDRLMIAEFPSLLLEGGFLLTRHPSTKNLPQFLSLLVDVSPSVVVVLDSEQSTTEEWVPERDNLVVGGYVVKQTKSRVISVNKRMSTICMAIQNGADEEVEMPIIEPVAPKDSDYSNVTPLSDIIDAFTSLTVTKDKPVIILNNENSVEVLVTTIVLNALHQLWFDGETDISLISRYLLTLQPSEPMSVDDYKKCYRLIHRFATRYFSTQNSMQEEHVYAN